MALDHQEITQTQRGPFSSLVARLPGANGPAASNPGTPARNRAFMMGIGTIMLMSLFSSHDSHDALPPRPILTTLPADTVLEPAMATTLPMGKALAAVQAMDLPAAQKQRLAADVRNGAVLMVALAPLDGRASAGSTITVDSGGLAQSITLPSSPMRIALPAPRNGLIRITGDRVASQGDIRLKYWNGGHAVALPRLASGQSVLVPIRQDGP